MKRDAATGRPRQRSWPRKTADPTAPQMPVPRTFVMPSWSGLILTWQAAVKTGSMAVQWRPST
jgi:hypothetical protein